MKKFLVFMIIFTPKISYGLDDNFLKSIEISTHANKFQSERLKIISENLANEDSTAPSPNEDPYRRKIIFSSNRFDRNLKTRLVKVKKFSEDQSSFKLRYDPYHPAADQNGYIKLPNVNKLIEKADAAEAQRSYDANLGMVEISKQMISKTLEAMR